MEYLPTFRAISRPHQLNAPRPTKSLLMLAERVRRSPPALHDAQPARAGRLVERSDCNLLDVCEEVKAVYPDQVITTEFSADLRTQCDVARMEQATGQAAKQRRQHGDAAARSRSPGE